MVFRDSYDEPILRDAASWVATHQDRMLTELFELIRQPSVSATGEGVAECAALLGDQMRRAGIETAVIDGEPYPFVAGRVAGPIGANRLLVYGHYDVQPAEPLEAWHSPPYAPEIRDGRIYGRGGADSKGQLFAHLKAVEFWREIVGEMPLELKFLFEGCEESHSRGMDEFAAANRDLLTADAALAADGPLHESGRPTLFFGVRGMIYVRVHLRVSRRDAHSAYATVLPNAAHELARILTELVGPDGSVNAAGFYDGLRPPSPLERAALGRIPPVDDEVRGEFGISRMAGDPALDYYEKLMFTPVVSIEALRAGYMGQGHKGAVPSTASATLNLRLVTDQDPEQAYNAVASTLQLLAGEYEVTLERLGASPPSRTSLDHPAVAPFIEALRRVDGQDPLLLPTIGAGCHANHILTRTIGLPAIWAPYAQPDEANHAPNENLRVDHFLRGILVSVAIFDQFSRWQRATPACGRYCG